MSELIATPVKLYTVDEFWAYCQLPENAGRRLELVKGEIRELPPTGGEHEEASGDLFGLVWTHNRTHKLGRVTNAETGYALTIGDDGKPFVRAPDIGFVSIARAPEPFASGFVPMPPDLAVEVVSPGDQAWEIEEKIQDYLRYGVRLIWVMYPASKTIMVHKQDGAKRLMSDDMLDGEDVLPGFRVKVSEIFPK